VNNAPPSSRDGWAAPHMTDQTTSRVTLAMTWTVLAISAVLFVLGASWYGISAEVNQRFWADLFDRLHGPMTIRFYLQPALAFVAASKDGIKDARFGHRAFFWTALWDSTVQRGRLREGLIATSQMGLIGFAMDTIYQFRVLDRFYPVEAVMMVLLLAVLPYFLFRWLVEHLARWWLTRTPVVS
jgi:hypothetical protein